MASDPRINLIVASLDLALVRLLRQAIRTADLSSGKSARLPAATTLARRVIEPQPRFEPRPVVHPTPRFEPRPVIHPTPRVGLDKTIPAPSPVADSCVKISKSPIEPPWRALPWENPAPPAPRLKVAMRQVDLPRKGVLFDVFI